MFSFSDCKDTGATTQRICVTKKNLKKNAKKNFSTQKHCAGGLKKHKKKIAQTYHDFDKTPLFYYWYPLKNKKQKIKKTQKFVSERSGHDSFYNAYNARDAN